MNGGCGGCAGVLPGYVPGRLGYRRVPSGCNGYSFAGQRAVPTHLPRAGQRPGDGTRQRLAGGDRRPLAPCCVPHL
eukprot:1194808-Prorocentrum_minimum.AAC.5